jgi:hypothetical protein
MVRSLHQKEIIYTAKDIPLFHYYQFRELAEFKMFFWMKTYHRYPSLSAANFDSKLVSENLMQIGTRIWENYLGIPSIEIWSQETVQITLRQIEFYYETGIISRQFAIQLCDQYLNLTENVMALARVGRKGSNGERYHLYKNDILIPENTILFRMGDRRVSFIAYRAMSLMTTSHESFCGQMEEFLNNLISNSELLSETGEKLRLKFFNGMQQKIHDFKTGI